ncbi:MAG: tetratricopeptide repeat protein [Blastocatellia bacterium]|nr:tetratricopeptide repeat protein [Blastocatellia bacterium]
MNRTTIVTFLIGTVVGFAFGYVSPHPQPAPQVQPPTTATPTGKTKPAPPLDPIANPRLPAGHPVVDGTEPVPGDGTPTKPSGPELNAAIGGANTNPGDFILQMKAAALCYQNGRLEEAVTFLKRAQVLRPDSFDAVSALGITHSELGKSAEAETWLTKALKINPNDTDTRAEYAVTLVNLKKFDQAITEGKRVIQTAPSQERALEALIKAFAARNNQPEAAKVWSQLSAVNPGNPNLPALKQLLTASSKAGGVASH